MRAEAILAGQDAAPQGDSADRDRTPLPQRRQFLVGPAVVLSNSRISAQQVLGQLFEEPLYCELALMEGGILAGHPGTIKGMEAFLECLPTNANWQWSVLSYGSNLFPVAAAAMERAVCFKPKSRICCGVGPMKALHSGEQVFGVPEQFVFPAASYARSVPSGAPVTV